MNRKFRNIVIIFSLTAFAVIGGCTVGPDYARPKTLASEAKGFVNAEKNGEFAQVGQWWERFDDPVISELVDKALESNLDLKAAAAQTLEAGALLERSRGARLPEVNYSFERSRGKTSFNLPTGRASFISQTYSQQISVSYIVDLFGRLRRTEQAALADFLASQANRRALLHSIIAQVVSARVEVATNQRLLEIARENIKNRERTLEIVERRYEAGLVGPLDVRFARENLAASKASSAGFKRAVVLAQHGLDVLLGRRPGGDGILPKTLPDIPELGKVPAGLPAGLLDRRPDVQASEFGLMAATERVGVSVAGLFPDLSLTGATGFSSDELSMLTSSETEVYSAVINLAAPLFRGGQQRAEVRASKARVEQAAANYAKTVLTAMREVEDALASQEILLERYEALKERLVEASKAQELATSRYQQGVEPILTVLETERRRTAAENELAQVKSAIWNARVNLFLALGGDWLEDD